MKILQFGTGNFLRGFIDWMIERMNVSCGLHASVTVVQSTSSSACERLCAANGRYHVLLRGILNGKKIDEMTPVTCISRCFHAQTQWADVLDEFCDPDLSCVFSNTTEAGIVYEPEKFDGFPRTFPAKLTAALFARFHSGGSGLVIFPCELIENNGATLLNCVRRYATDENLPAAFFQWLETECTFCDTLVDRIVPGAPKNPEEIAAIEKKFAVRDPLLVCAEPFYFFVVQDKPAARALLPFQEAGLNVLFSPDITPYRERKVRLLNGAHTASVSLALLCGLSEVGQMTADPLFLSFLRRLLFQELMPTVSLPVEEKRAFAEAVLERFSNPFVHHRLESIALNGVSKWKVRDFPPLFDFAAANGHVPPPLLTFSFASLIVMYVDNTAPDLQGAPCVSLRDDPDLLAFFASCGKTFSHDVFALVTAILRDPRVTGSISVEERIPGFSYRVASHVMSIRSFGCRQTLERLMDESC